MDDLRGKPKSTPSVCKAGEGCGGRWDFGLRGGHFADAIPRDTLSMETLITENTKKHHLTRTAETSLLSGPVGLLVVGLGNGKAGEFELQGDILSFLL